MTKKTLLGLFFLLICFTSFSQTYEGDWYGNLSVSGIRLPLVFHIHSIGKKKYDVTLDSPSQKAFGIKASMVQQKKDSLFTEFNHLAATYHLHFKNDTLKGVFNQLGNDYGLNLVRDSLVIAKPNRPQTPKEPFSYQSKEITFENKHAKITLAGTLTFPNSGSNFKAVVLVSGSGPQDRNETMMEHEPFLVLSDYLTRNGIVVLRYDDRGIGQSKGIFSTATTYDFASDALSAVEYLKTLPNIDTTHIGIIGHSEGGMVAEILASKSPKMIDFAVFLAAPGISLDELMLEQNKDFAPQNTPPEELKAYLSIMQGLYTKIKSNECNSKCVMDYLKENDPEYTKNPMKYTSLVMQLSTPWMQEFLRFEPAFFLKKITIPILAVNGNKDMQVKFDKNIAAIKNGLKQAGNSDFTLKIYKDLNHLFQPCKTGMIDEYQTIETTFSEEVMEDIANWINDLK